MKSEDYLEINKHTWNNKTDIHIASSFYDNEGFLNGKSTLKQIELELLGDVSGKKILHLQCHFGQDTMTFSRMGAHATGVDLSDKAISRAREFASKLGLSSQFINSDIYDLPQNLQEQFDIVFTSYGTIGWLPDMEKWANVIAHFLKPNGKFIMAEFHPVVWMFDNAFKEIEYSYFNVEPIVEMVNGTYADRQAPMETKTITWNHPTSEVLNALLQSGLEINSFQEYDYSPYNCFENTKEIAPNKFIIAHLGNKIPMVFSIVATKKT